MLPCFIRAQDFNNLRTLEFHIDSDTIHIDSLSIIPNTVVIADSTGNILNDNQYSVDFAKSLIIISSDHYNNLADKSYKISYRVFPYYFSKTYKYKDASWIIPRTEEPYNPFVYRYQEEQSNLFMFSGLSKSGSISRVISFGNNQNVVVNSNFNLQLAGKLSKDIDVIAAITDNNIPIQPEGNTQQIQEFDKVYIQLSIKNTSLVVGDFELTRPESHFMNFYKKAQGGDLTTNFNIKSKKKGRSLGLMKLRTAAALSKGKFVRNKFSGTEGNQGPYKLIGKEGETYIIILSGSEKVYIDGKLLTRGESFDYTINYNTGEITFTPNILITKDKRIIVEFEYSNKQYARALFFIGNEFENEKLNIRLNIFSEQDLKNQPLQQDLTDEQKILMSNIGDSIQDALIWNIDSAGFASDQVRYKLVDTLISGIYYDTIFVHSVNPDSAVYEVGFSNVGQGKGHYNLIKSDANGRVFQWKAPVNGIPQGSYEPIRILVTPKKTQMVTFSTDYTLSKNSNLSGEIALSNFNINTFSDKDKGNDVGYAAKFNFNNKIIIGRHAVTPWTMSTGLYYEWVNRNFTPIEPYRPVEFNRDWNLEPGEKGNENYGGINISFANLKTGMINYEFRTLLKGSDYQGIKNKLNFNLNFSNFTVDFDGSLLNTNDITYNTLFIRNKAKLSKKFKWFILGVNEEQEYNKFVDLSLDSLLVNSFSFNEWGFFAMNADSTHNKLLVHYKHRTDRLPYKNSFKQATIAEEIRLIISLQKNRSNRLNITATYHNLKVKDTLLSSNKPDHNVVGRIEHFLSIKKGLITANTFYEIGSGLEEKKEFSYLKVPAGEGVYVWNDYNEDGIQQLNEFEVSPFKDEADYIRIFSPSNEYIRSYFNQFSESLLFNPAILWINETGFKKFLSKFSDQLAFRIEHKTSDDKPNNAYNPFISEKFIHDSLLLSLGSSFRNTLYFDRNNPEFGFDLNFRNNRNKALLVNGFETRIIRLRGINIRWNFYKAFSIILKYDFGSKVSSSEFFSSRDYDIDFNKIGPQFSYQPSPSLQIDLKYNYTTKLNTPGATETKANIHDLGVEINYKIVNKGSLLIKGNYLDVSYNDLVNNSLAFEMLEGYQPGSNGTWSISYQQNIASHLQLNLLYNGRKSPGVKTVHIGSVQLRAYF